MKEHISSPQFLRKRKFFTVLPLLAFPFMTLLFWSMGGGRVDHASAHQQEVSGLNPKLPDAYEKKGAKPMDKLSYYEKAAFDSVKLREQIKSDPYYKATKLTATENFSAGTLRFDELKTARSTQVSAKKQLGSEADATEVKINAKLAELKKAIQQPPNSVNKSPSKALTTQPAENMPASHIDQVQQMVQNMKGQQSDDPEMARLDGMLDKILVIEQAQGKAAIGFRDTSLSKNQVCSVSRDSSGGQVSNLNAPGSQDSNSAITDKAESNAFYSLTDSDSENTYQNSIEAVVHETQTLVAGSTVKLRLLNDINVDGTTIPKDNFVFGKVNLSGERLSISISSIRYGNSIFSVKMSVYDMDGMEGIDIPGAITRDAAKQSADRAVQNLGVTSLDPSLGAQAATAGIEAAKTLFGKKIRLVKVTLKAGYAVLLHDSKQKLSKI